ncbi:MAG: hypothetical protein EB059_08320 [Alphaproteobacteria bacterium]|nr:hypothetical protein [Alphaproteobacteria bacterium]
MKDDIVFKPHPLEKVEQREDVGVPPYEEDMETALREAKIIVTCSSTSGVDAWLRGVPATAASPISMIFKAQHEPATPENRQCWLNDISYRQFSEAEFKSGLVWELCGKQMLEAKPDTHVPQRNMNNMAALISSAALVASL